MAASTKGDSEGELQDQTPDTDDSGAHSYPEISTSSTFAVPGTGSFKRAPIMGNRGLEHKGKKPKTSMQKQTSQTVGKVCKTLTCLICFNKENMKIIRHVNVL